MRRILLAIALVGGAAACRARGPVGTYSDAPVVLISIDTLRADHLPLYGYRAGRTPNLDRLGREGIVFEDVYSHCPMTLPAHASLFTGLLPPRHGVRDNLGFRLAPNHKTLATRFKAAGLRTGGAISAYVLRAATGISQGFDFYDDALEIEGGTESMGNLQRDGGAAVEALARFVDEQQARRFFAFLHLYEPHSPYAPPERYRSKRSPYDGDVSYADELVGRFLDRLKARGLYDRALIALTSDHGEGLSDHGEEEHGIFLYREALRVPLIVRLPGGARAGARIGGLVAQADIAPTLLDLAGVASEGMDGVSLRGTLDGNAHEGAVYSETYYPRYHFGWSELLAVTEGRYRYIRAPRTELYDVSKDPGEKHNLSEERASVGTAMARWLDQKAASDAAKPEEVPREVREKLQALGYVGSGGAATPEKAVSRPDPKDRIASHEDFKRGLALRLGGQREQAAEQLQKVVAASPDMADAWEMLGVTLIELDRRKEGLAAYDRAIRIDPTRPEPHLAVARVLALEGRRDLAQQHAEIAVEREPGRGYETLAEIMLDQGSYEKAAVYARRSLDADPRRVMSHFALGVVAQRAGRLEEALAAFRRAADENKLQKRSVVTNLHASMADCLARLGREKEAEVEFRAEIEVLPWSREARVGLAMLYRSQARDAEARSVLEGLVTTDPRAGADSYFTVVRTFSVLGDVDAARAWAARARARYPGDARFR